MLDENTKTNYMKISEYIAKRALLFVCVAVTSGFIYYLPVFQIMRHPNLFMKIISGISGIVCIGSILCFIFLVRCPRCHGRLGHLSNSMSVFGKPMKKGIKFCPHCGVSFGDEL